jgi:hypothetical protein
MIFENNGPHAVIDSHPGQFGVIHQTGEDGGRSMDMRIDRTAYELSIGRHFHDGPPLWGIDFVV